MYYETKYVCICICVYITYQKSSHNKGHLENKQNTTDV